MINKIKPYLISIIIIQFMFILFHPIISFAATVTIDSLPVQGKDVTLSGTFQGPGLLETVTVELEDNNGVKHPVTTIGYNWSYNATLSEGNYNYKVIRTTKTLGILLPQTEEFPFTFTVDGTGPTIVVNSSSFQNKNGLITGTVADNHTPGNLITLSLMQVLDANSNIINGFNLTGPTFTNDQWIWSISLPIGLAEGIYQYKVKSNDSYGNSTEMINSFTLDNTRPKVSSVKVNFVDSDSSTGQSEINLLTSEEMNHIKRDTNIKITFTDDKMLSVDQIRNLIVVNSNGIPIDGSISNPVISQDQLSADLIFTPNCQLESNKTYYILVNPYLIDKTGENSYTTDTAGNTVFPLIKKFTTEREVSPVSIPNDKIPYYNLDDPHGNYTLNTNTCGTCHNTHISDVPTGSEATKLQLAPNKYCMACHDGTVAPASFPQGVISNGHFADYSQTEVNKMTGECTACHNPHLTWNNENPNLLKDHLVYKHIDSEKLPKIYDTVNKSDTCNNENCHTETARELKDRKDTNGNPLVSYSVLHYRKSTITKGNTDDYDLCLSCHDGSNLNIPNIKAYYDDTSSKHRITAVDGSQLTADNTNFPNGGHIPCAECHDTHGSSNIKVLKDKLGQEDRKTFTAGEIDKNSFGILKADKEREFCIKCHNGATAIYGVTGQFLQARVGHDPIIDKDTACSSCHGTGTTPEEKALSAAHAPKTGTP